jgi:oligopeptide/dipeptide ABC transporter ATP-binding protein
MYAGQVVEQAPTFELFDAVRMPYTQALLDAVPNMTDPPHVELAVVAGRPPDPAELPVGCAFSTRCPRVEQRCKDEPPELLEHEVGHWYSCFYPLR